MDATQIIDSYRGALPAGRLVECDLSGMDRLGVPFHLLTLYADDAPTNAGSGYGMIEAEARIGAFGELTEVTQANRALALMKQVKGCYRDLLLERGKRGIVNPLELCLEAGCDYTDQRELEWVACERFSTGEPVLVPIEFVACQNSDIPRDSGAPARERLITLITNGLGAGLRRDDAISHGLLELLQRDGNSVRFRALAEPTAIELDDVRDAATRELLAHLDAQGVDVIVKLASTDFGFTNLYVVGCDRTATHDSANQIHSINQIHPIAALACGEAVHPNREVALRKALLEFAAARSRLAFSHGSLQAVERVAPHGYLADYFSRYTFDGEEPRALLTMQRLYRRTLGEMRQLLAERVMRVTSTIPFSSLPTTNDLSFTADRAQLAAHVADKVQQAGFDILVADYTAPGAQVFAVKVIVPGLEVETLSYHRIGERNARRLLADGNILVSVGAAPSAAAQRVRLTPEAEHRLGGKVWFDTETARRIVGDLYALYREPGRHATALSLDGYDAHTHSLGASTT